MANLKSTNKTLADQEPAEKVNAKYEKGKVRFYQDSFVVPATPVTSSDSIEFAPLPEGAKVISAKLNITVASGIGDTFALGSDADAGKLFAATSSCAAVAVFELANTDDPSEVAKDEKLKLTTGTGLDAGAAATLSITYVLL